MQCMQALHGQQGAHARSRHRHGTLSRACVQGTRGVHSCSRRTCIMAVAAAAADCLCCNRIKLRRCAGAQVHREGC